MIKPRLTHLVAHRGNARDFPENTLPAFRSALQLGVRFLELDVQLSADGIPVVIHDHLLARTTGLPGSVFDHSAAELLQMEAAQTDRFGTRHAGTRIPSLQQVLELLRGRPEITLFVEIKRASLAHYGHEQVIATLARALEPWKQQCVAISFDLPAICQIRQSTTLPVGWVLSECNDHARLKFEALQPEYLFCDHLKLPAQGNLWRGPWRWVIYEVESLPLAMELAHRGADYIETMAVAELGAALRGAAGA